MFDVLDLIWDRRPASQSTLLKLGLVAKEFLPKLGQRDHVVKGRDAQNVLQTVVSCVV